METTSNEKVPQVDAEEHNADHDPGVQPPSYQISQHENNTAPVDMTPSEKTPHDGEQKTDPGLPSSSYQSSQPAGSETHSVPVNPTSSENVPRDPNEEPKTDNVLKPPSHPDLHRAGATSSENVPRDPNVAGEQKTENVLRPPSHPDLRRAGAPPSEIISNDPLGAREQKTDPGLRPPSHPDSHHTSIESDSSDQSHNELGETPVSSNLPEATNPTVAFAIPFPQALHPTDKVKEKLPPFVLYAPLAGPLSKPAEGEKEGYAHKAQRKWQEEERAAKEKGTGFKAKAVALIAKGMSATKNSRIEFLVRTPNKKKLKELRIIYPASYSPDDIRELFTDMIKKAKSGAIRNGIISSAMLPFVLAFDVVTFIAGPFEINAVWAASSWTGAARAAGISNRVTSDTLPINLSSDARLNILAYRLHEICWRKVKGGTVAKPRWDSKEPIRRGPDLAGVALEVMKDHGEDMDDLETSRMLVGEDLEACLKKGAKEWAKILS